MPRPGVIPGGFGDLFSTALWELGLGFTPAAILASLNELYPTSVPMVNQGAINLAQQAQNAAMGLMGFTPIPWGGPAPLPIIAGVQGGFYYDVVCSFWDEEDDFETDRLIRVSSDDRISAEEIYGKAWDLANQFQQKGSERFIVLDLAGRQGRKMQDCRIVAAFQGIG